MGGLKLVEEAIETRLRQVWARKARQEAKTLRLMENNAGAEALESFAKTLLGGRPVRQPKRTAWPDTTAD